jgi:hypothetical protein
VLNLKVVEGASHIWANRKIGFERAKFQKKIAGRNYGEQWLCFFELTNPASP